MHQTRNYAFGIQRAVIIYRPIIVVIVLYIVVNIYNYSRPVVIVTNNLIGLIFLG